MTNIWYPFTQHLLAKPPLKVVKGEGAKLFLEDGRVILDAISSWWVNLHGHCHPKLVQALAEQASKLEHVIFSGFTHDPALHLAENLLPLLPEKIKKVFFSDNGSTAVEVALKMAWQYQKQCGEKRHIFIAFEGAYHGDTIGAMSLGARSLFSEPFDDLLFDVIHLPYPVTPKLEQEVLQRLEELLQEKGPQIVALLIEPLVQGVAGMRMCTPKFLQEMEKKLKREKVLCIYDEVMTGFGRVGDLFAATRSKTSPDLIALSKGITGGFLPLALTCATDEIFSAFLSEDRRKTFYHGHSYTANPLGCQVAVASLELLLEEAAYTKFEALHKRYLTKLEELPCVEEVRVMGTIAAVALKSSEGGYLDALGQKMYPRFIARGVLLRPLGNVFYLMPPYCTTEEELQRIYQVLEEELLLLGTS